MNNKFNYVCLTSVANELWPTTISLCANQEKFFSNIHQVIV